MGQQAALTLYDGAATPVAHVFTGDFVKTEKSDVIAQWREQLSTVPVEAQPRYIQILRTLKSGMKQLVARIEVPVSEATSTGGNVSGYIAPAKVAFVERVDIVRWAHPRSSESTARIAYQLALNAMNNNSGTTPPVVAGPTADLLQRQIQVS